MSDWEFLAKCAGAVLVAVLCLLGYVGLRDADRVVKTAEDFVKRMPDNRREKQ